MLKTYFVIMLKKTYFVISTNKQNPKSNCSDFQFLKRAYPFSNSAYLWCGDASIAALIFEYNFS
jgi:hypothetical protein